MKKKEVPTQHGEGGLRELIRLLFEKPDALDHSPQAAPGPYREHPDVMRAYEAQFEALSERTKRGFTWRQVIALPVNREKLIAPGERTIVSVGEDGELFFSVPIAGSMGAWTSSVV